MRRREVLVFVRREDEFLVLLRSHEGGGYWHCVAGGVEDGESDLAAAHRELQEETGLDAAALQPVGSYVYEPYGISCSCYVAVVDPLWEPTLDHEHVEYRWCARDDACALLYWPEPRELLERV
ncbi:MAG TPA: NUDIX domain-containing protein [Gaiellaceae bacterium]|nr:NUDIX domain-containing protein [Gaiellaceae bacterium]